MDWLPKAAFDVTMAKTFSDPLSPLYWDTIGDCCVTPPIGHHQPHISGTSGKMQGAKTSWKKSVHTARWNFEKDLRPAKQHHLSDHRRSL